MDKKVLKSLAERIVKCELILQNEKSSYYTCTKAMKEIATIADSIYELEDMALLDEMVQEMLEERT